MIPYKILIQDRNYSSWSITNSETNVFENIEHFNPLSHKLFSKDIFHYTMENNNIDLVYSQVRYGTHYAGVLMLENNKTFGRTENKKRLLYKCIPDDKSLPAFLVPYEIKIGFNKIQKNKYVIFKFDNWLFQHPYGILIEVLGDTDNLTIFYEYQLYCKSLHVSLTEFTNSTKEQLRKKSANEYIDQILNNTHFSIENRILSYNNIFSIDPISSTDFDDAFSVQKMDENTYIVSVYIANVFFWIETLGLWKSFSSRVSTIYLPDRRRPMLPTILSDNLCSLQEGESRFAFTLDITIDISNIKPIIKDIKYLNTMIKVYKNYRYEEPQLLYKNENYKMLLEISQKMDRSIIDSHDIVAHWMVFMNNYCGNLMANNKIGIFRSAHYLNNKNLDKIDHLNDDTQRIIKSWNNIAGQYTIYDENITLNHELMKTKNYIHITSPIRRLVDLLNQIWILKHNGIQLSKDATDFFNSWLLKMDYMNGSMRSIRKIQTDCEVLNRCFNDPNIMNNNYEGIIFDKIIKNNGSITYMVYLNELKLLSRITSYTDVENYTQHKFKIYLFEDDLKVKKKIRLQII